MHHDLAATVVQCNNSDYYFCSCFLIWFFFTFFLVLFCELCEFLCCVTCSSCVLKSSHLLILYCRLSAAMHSMSLKDFQANRHSVLFRCSSVGDADPGTMQTSENSGDLIFHVMEPLDMNLHSEATLNSFEFGCRHLNSERESGRKFQRSLTEGNIGNYRLSPPRVDESQDIDPMTPTTNLKLLVKALSPDMRLKDQQEAMGRSWKGLYAHVPQQMEIVKSAEEDFCFADEDSNCDQKISRKEKSRGLLCRR